VTLALVAAPGRAGELAHKRSADLPALLLARRPVVADASAMHGVELVSIPRSGRCSCAAMPPTRSCGSSTG
jgi:hypothetical protein